THREHARLERTGATLERGESARRERRALRSIAEDRVALRVAATTPDDSHGEDVSGGPANSAGTSSKLHGDLHPRAFSPEPIGRRRRISEQTLFAAWITEADGRP